ncbi:MAG: DUF1080 domain-containing protein [Vicinamibacterales bacterium]
MTLTAIFLASTMAAAALFAPSAQQQTPSALEADPKGWVDLVAGNSLKGWTRVPLGPVGKLPAGKESDPSPWRVEGATLVCQGDKAGHEMLRYDKEIGDFVLHVEWRFTKLEGEPGYNSGVFVKAAADGGSWFQAQTGAAGGYLFGAGVPVAGKPGRINLRDKMVENRVKPAGEWNTYEIRAQGKNLVLWVNGAVVNDYPDCEVPRGYIGLEAEGYRLEFRNLKLKEIVR